MGHPIIILGAGVIGLQTAVTLLEAGYSVTIVARDWPGDESIEYTSPWAGAIWRSHASPDDVERCEWDKESYASWMRIVKEKSGKAEKMGLKLCPCHIYSDQTSALPWYAQHVQNLATFQASSLLPGGHSLDSIAVNPITHIKYLLTRAKELGATFLKLELSKSNDLAAALQLHQDVLFPSEQSTDRTAKPTVLINCTGMGAKELCGDEGIYPIRGQTLLARIQPSPPAEILLWDGEADVTYIVPRPGTDTFILGGTKDAGNYDPNPTPSITKGIIERCQKLLSDRGIQDAKIEVVAHQVGLRPGRKGGVRIEVEEFNIADKGTVSVVHQYGHAGAGYQASIGSAKKVLLEVQKILD